MGLNLMENCTSGTMVAGWEKVVMAETEVDAETEVEIGVVGGLDKVAMAEVVTVEVVMVVVVSIGECP